MLLSTEMLRTLFDTMDDRHQSWKCPSYDAKYFLSIDPILCDGDGDQRVDRLKVE